MPSYIKIKQGQMLIPNDEILRSDGLWQKISSELEFTKVVGGSFRRLKVPTKAEI